MIWRVRFCCAAPAAVAATSWTNRPPRRSDIFVLFLSHSWLFLLTIIILIYIIVFVKMLRFSKRYLDKLLLLLLEELFRFGLIWSKFAVVVVVAAARATLPKRKCHWCKMTVKIFTSLDVFSSVNELLHEKHFLFGHRIQYRFYLVIINTQIFEYSNTRRDGENSLVIRF